MEMEDLTMARGWESKSVEMQIEEREHTVAPPGNTIADAGRKRETELLELSRKRLLGEIEATHNPRLKEQKQRALSFVENRINELNRA
jgi:hypothetical protein